MQHTRVFTLIFIAILGVGLVWFALNREFVTRVNAIASFTECADAGFPVMESYPRQCRDANGNLFVEDVTAEWTVSYTNASPDFIRNVNITAGGRVSSPLTITGEARGYWFFEASFPVILTDWDGRIIAQHYATADGEWMTEEFVPFETTIEFETPESWGGPVNRGTLILKRDNPSGLPEHDAALEIPVVFE